MTTQKKNYKQECSRVEEILRRCELYTGEIYEAEVEDPDSGEITEALAVHIIWGDWKHSHARLDYIMKENGYELLGEMLTEDDGSDCYSATHFYV